MDPWNPLTSISSPCLTSPTGSAGLEGSGLMVHYSQSIMNLTGSDPHSFHPGVLVLTSLTRRKEKALGYPNEKKGGGEQICPRKATGAQEDTSPAYLGGYPLFQVPTQPAVSALRIVWY